MRCCCSIALALPFVYISRERCLCVCGSRFFFCSPVSDLSLRPNKYELRWFSHSNARAHTHASMACNIAMAKKNRRSCLCLCVCVYDCFFLCSSAPCILRMVVKSTGPSVLLLFFTSCCSPSRMRMRVYERLVFYLFAEFCVCATVCVCGMVDFSYPLFSLIRLFARSLFLTILLSACRRTRLYCMCAQCEYRG